MKIINYHVEFTGRLNGALGITYPMEAVVGVPENVEMVKEAISLELHKKYERVHIISWVKE